MVDAFVGDIVSGLVQKLVSLASDEVIQAWNVHEDLEALRERLESINALLSDALTKKPTMSSVNEWFNKLDDVAHVAVVFLDQLAYEVTRQKVVNHHKLRKFFIPSENRILYRFKVAHKMKSIHTSFNKIFKWASDLGIQPVAHLSWIVQRSEIRDTTPYEDESRTVGRDNDTSYLVQTLSKNYQDNLPVIGVVGLGGQGKTTLVRKVYNRDDVINMFPRRMWVTVSDHFDFMKILNQIVESLTSTSSVLTNTEGVINAIRKKLERKTFLLVLDDVWNDKPEEWEKLRNSLLGVGGARGSKILVTTRNQEVMDAMRCSVSYQLEKLSTEDSWALFKHRAFSHGVLETEAFAALGRKMVDRCGGLPLAIKTIGGLLHSKKSEKEWLLISNSEIWKSKGVLSSLRLSYDYLPYPSLKRCFAYCSIIPKGSYIYRDQLVQIWMALGFLMPPTDSNALMEEVGNEYFNILLWRSLLQDVERNALGNIIRCKMHDLVHDLAIDLSEHHSVTVRAGHELNHISKAKYVRIDESVSDIKPTILKRNFERVQVLYAADRILNSVLPYLQNLNVLVLINDRVTTELPRSMCMMKCLKYLDISGFRLKLPTYITDLYNLQTLRATSLYELPKNFCNLINLRHFFIEVSDPAPRCQLNGIERLTNLQTLPHFVVSKDQNCLIGQLEGMKNLSGKLELYGLSDIDNMEESCKASLGTKSNIEHLKLVWSSNYEEKEEREYKEGTEELKYNDRDVMEGLKPHTNLKTLSIVNFKGKKFASWITMMMNLVKITLKDCKRCEGFPPLGHLPKLSEMEIFRMNSLKVISSDFYGGQGHFSNEVSKSGAGKSVTTLYPSLRKLRLCDLPKLEELIEPLMHTVGEDQSVVIAFPKLEELYLHCRKLITIPSGCFTSLKKLTIKDSESSSMILARMSKNLSSLTSLKLLNISDSAGSDSSSNIDSIIDELLKNNSLSLTNLSLEDCHGLTRLSPGVAVQTLSVADCPDLTSINVVEESGGLKDVTVVGCPSLSDWVFVQTLSSTLESLSVGAFSEELDEFPWPCPCSFPNLISLYLFGWEKLKYILPAAHDASLSSIFPALIDLSISHFKRLEALPDSLAKLPSLSHLLISECENLTSLPVFEESDSLQLLSISECPILEENCKGSGSEWFKIQYIPRVTFSPLLAGVDLFTFLSAMARLDLDTLD